jgi:heparan-alpha-glucosaminide N-acetyltransferase
MSALPSTELPLLPVARLTSLDAYRGFVMLLMGLELLHLDEVAVNFPQSSVWQCLGFHSWHVPWVGCCLHDLIHPSFVFMVGVALAFSISSRVARGQGLGRLWLHALGRSVCLILLGIFVRSLGRDSTHWTFEDTLTQMGLGYPVLFGLSFATQRVRWACIGLILVGYWWYFVQYPFPPAGFNDSAVNIPDGWPHHAQGFFAHWNLNQNAAWAFDSWFLNLFPRSRPWVGYTGGYNTLNFIPTLANMILGLIAGVWLKRASSQPRSNWIVIRLLKFGVAGILLGWGMHWLGICPLIKKLWTPSWVLFSGGWSFILMAAFYYIMDVRHYQRWAFPFIVIGMNSLAMYLLFHTIDEFLEEALVQHFGPQPFLLLGPEMQPVLLGSCVLLILWLILLWMHKRKLYLKI